jgi:ribose transport system permease protein
MSSLTLPRFSGIWLGTLALFGVGFLLNPNTLSSTSIYSMLPFFAILAIASLGQTMVVMQRGLDLSVPGAIAASAVAFTKMANVHDDQVVQGIILAFAVVALAGLVAGIAVTRFHVTPLVATLGTNALLLAFTNWYSGGFPTGAPEGMNQFALGKAFGLVPNMVVVLVVLVLVAQALLRHSVLGRRFVAVGINPRAAHAVGIPVERYVIGTYVIASLFYGLAGIFLASFIKTPPIFSGTQYLLGTVAAVVLGGTALGGGVGSFIATVGGALFLSQLSAIVLGVGFPNSVQQVVQALAIVLVVGLRTVPWHRLRRSSAAAPGAPPPGAAPGAPPLGAAPGAPPPGAAPPPVPPPVPTDPGSLPMPTTGNRPVDAS